MRFRIKSCHGGYMPQVFEEGRGWDLLGAPGRTTILFSTIEDAKKACIKYKNKKESEIVEEFEL